MLNASTADSDDKRKSETKSASNTANKPSVKSQPMTNPTPDSKPKSSNGKSQFETDNLIPLPDSEIPN